MRYLATTPDSPVLPILTIAAAIIGLAAGAYMFAIWSVNQRMGKGVAAQVKKNDAARAKWEGQLQPWQREDLVREKATTPPITNEASFDDFPISAIAANDEAHKALITRLKGGDDGEAPPPAASGPAPHPFSPPSPAPPAPGRQRSRKP